MSNFNENCVEQMEALARRAIPAAQKESLIAMADFVRQGYIPADSPIVKDILGDKWARVDKFFEHVRARQSVNEFALVKDGFTAHAYNHVFIFGPQRPRARVPAPPKPAVPLVSPPRPDYLKSLKGLGMLIGFLCLLGMTIWATHVLLVTFGSGRKQEEPSCRVMLEDVKKLVAEQAATSVNLRQLVAEQAQRVTLLETGAAKAESVRDERQQRAFVKFERDADGLLQEIRTSVKVLGDRVGEVQVNLETAELQVRSAGGKIDGLNEKVQEINDQIPALSTSLANTKNLASDLKDQVKDTKDALSRASTLLEDGHNNWLFMFVAGCAFVTLVCGGSYCNMKTTADEVKGLSCLTTSHQLSGRVFDLEIRVKALEAPVQQQDAFEEVEEAARAPVGPGRGRGRGPGRGRAV